MNALTTAKLPTEFPAPWANEWGQDKYGLFMVLVVNGVRQRFRWIMPGTFEMGEDKTKHPVSLTQGFWLADTACTQALWTAVMNNNPSRFKEHPDHPVENLSWDDAQQFIAQLQQLFPALPARLPTEAEWEYACRAGTTTAYAFGDEITREQVNFDSDKTVPVKSLPANAWGLYAMHGNVWECCADWYGDYPVEAVTDPVGPTEGASRVLRGGSWLSYARYTRSARRDRHYPGARLDGYGFRLALGRTGLSPGQVSQ